MEGQSDVDQQVATAAEPVYVLMTKKHRVSRSYRTEWLITNLVESPNEEEKNDDDNDLYMIATSKSPPNVINSNVFFMNHCYSLVFVLDMSSTMLQVSNETFAIKLDEGVKALVTLLEQLINPMDIPSFPNKFSPQLFISVLVYSGSTDPQKRVTVLFQGAHLNTDSVTDMIDIARKGILKLENKQASKVKDHERDCSGTSTRADNCLEKMIKAGHLGVQLLPREAIKGIIVITDGIGGFTTPSSMHSTVNQLRTANIGCWVVLCGGGSSPSLSLGSIPDTQAVGFITEACNGSVIDPAKLLQVANSIDDDESSMGINPCQKCILLWSAQSSSWRERRDCLVSSGFCEHQIDPFVPQRVYMQNRTTVTLPLTTLIGCRAREGFLVESALIKESIFEIVLTYPWQSNIIINYSIRTSWPVSMTTSCTLLITVSFIAPYPFVRDFQSDIHQFTGPHATSLKRFKQTLKSLTHSDTFLSHSIAFSTNAQFYTLPSSFDKGMPLFHNPNPNQSKLVPAQGSGDSKALTVLCKYWTPLASLDINIWTKWMHTEKIILVLSQDSALPPHLLHPSSSGRYSTLQCRVAALKLFTCLHSWCSLTLLENQLFLKFLPNDGSPCHFCVVRVSQMQPCVLIHVGFIEGTPHVLQIDTVTKLCSTIKKLVISLPLKESQMPSIKGKKSCLPQQPCTTIINKQLQKMLISYDLPRETTSEVPVQLEYLNRFEWQWDVPHHNPDLLIGLLQQRLREGFLIASSSNGIATLVAQIRVKQPCSAHSFPSLIQYVIFPFNQVTGKFLTEVWVEPQYQVVSETPPGLEYLRNEKTDNIPYKIHSKDICVLTQITTFLEYSPNRKDSVMSSPVVGSEAAIPLTVKFTQDIHSDLSSLYSHSHVTTLAFSAFTEADVTSSGPLTLADCSRLNVQLNRKFLNLLIARLTATTVLVKEPDKLVQRLRDSDELKPFFELYLETTSHPLWKCFIIDDPKGLLLIFTPCFVCCSDPSVTDTTTEAATANVFSFPVVLMYTTLPHLLGEDTVLSGLQPLPLDTHFDCLFDSQKSSSKLSLSSGFNPMLLNKVKHIHTLAYLSALQDSLTMAEGKDLLSIRDLEKGLTVCSKATLTIDLTPLLMGVCHHCGLTNGTNVTIETLASLLETLDQQNHDHSVQLIDDNNYGTGGSNSRCSQREKDINNLFREFLEKIGFISVNRMGYYWYKEDQKHSRETSVVDDDDDDDDDDNNDDEKTDTSFGTPPPHNPTMTDVTMATNSDDDSDFDLSNLEPIFTPPSKSTSTRVIHIDHAPLFIRLRTVLSSIPDASQEEEQRIEKIAEQGNMSLCSESLFSGTSVKPSSNQYWKLSLAVEAFSMLEDRDLAEDKRSQTDPSMFSIHSCFRPVISLLKSKTEWLVKDELVSRARELFDNEEAVPPSLLPSVTSHIQGSFKRFNNCLMEQIPVRFVLGQSSSSPQFMQFLSSIDLPDLRIHRAENNYFYFTSEPPGISNTCQYSTPPRIEKGRSKARSSTPTSIMKFPSRQNLLHSHRRSRSLTSDLSSISSTQALAVPSSYGGNRKSVSSVESPLECPLEEVTDSMYDASKSNSVTSIVTNTSTPISCCTVEEEDKVWIVLRVVTHQVEVYLHSRCSLGLSTEHCRKQVDQCSSVIKAVQAICHKTNQWHLLKDLLDTHLCSPLLLAESSSAAWVEGTTNAAKEITVDGETFTSREFECKLQWREHITPHWRLKSMGNNIALKITSSALSAFAVSNRQDIYVLQDVMDDGEEAVFYLRVSESVCVEESNFNDEAPLTFDDPQRCDTRATVDDDNISNFSYQRSSFDVAETPSQLSRQESTSLFSLNSETRKSVVLELYGITAPSDSMTTRLQRLIRSKLDDIALEMMCSMYTRNLRLELSNDDVQFLQEYPEKPSEVFSIPIPEWVSYPQALFYYILQQFSILFTKPQYNTVDGPYSVLSVPPAVDEVLRESNLNTSIQHDLLNLYIRPLNKGRGMALITACLVSPEGVVLPPILDILPPTILPNVPDYDDIRNIYTIEQFPVISDRHTIALHIWERGNVGMNELRSKLVSAVQCGLVDVLMEIHFLQLPIATLTDDEINGLISPGLLRRSRYSASISNSENLSFVDVTLTSSKESMETAQRDIEEPVKGLVVMDTGSPDWEQREKQRRQQDCREILKRDALMGKRGVMKKEFLDVFTMFLTSAHEIGLPEVFYHSWRVPTNYVVNTVLSQALSTLSSSLASLSSSCEMNFSIWKIEPDSPNFRFFSRTDFESSKETQQPCGYHSNNTYVIIGRDLNQWKEAMDPYDCTLRQEQYWPNEQHFLPLSSWKKYNDKSILLHATARKHNTFIPRQRMVLAYLVDGMFHLWLYNVIEDRVKEIKARITNLESWQFKRSGLLYHILSQKMGLFHHTGSGDIAPLTQRAVKYCNNVQGIPNLVNNVTPIPSPKPQSSRQSFELDHFYQDLEPSVGLSHTHSDPVKRHGHQFYETFSSHRETIKHLDLLLKVFNTWDINRRSKTDQSTPISSEVISKLKQTSRLLHYCSSSVWLLSKSYVSNLPETVSEQTILEDASSWFNCIREKFLSEYVAYLQTLHFQSINERPPSRPKGQLSPPHSPTKFHKCLQRSWPGGIILIELSFQTQLFLVKLYSLELSRSSNLPPPSYDVSKLFSHECSRIKDYIHTHSFNYDFHVRNIHSIVQGRLKVEGELDLRNLLNEFCNNYVSPPFYIRNRVCSDHFKIKVSVHSKALYTHIIGHCSEYSLQRIDVIQASGNGCGSSIAWDNCLMIDLRSSITGGITAPELSCVLKETKDMYNVIVLAMPDVNEGEGPIATELPLKIYMLLVNKFEMYPRLTSNSPLISNRKAPTVLTSEGEIVQTTLGRGGDSGSSLGVPERQSELHDSVMYHRRKLGYGSLSSPSSISEMVFNPHVLSELMYRLKVHFENIVKSAQSHVRRDELWKRLLYGGLSPDIPVLSHPEFMELLMLVRYEELEQFDSILAPLKHQTKKWYQNLIDFLQQKFDNFKIFRESLSDTIHAVIVNENWHDMLMMVVCGGHSQGFYTVYRKSHEAGTSFEERKLTANIEAEQLHINDFVNYVCSFVWVDIMNNTPSMSPKSRR